MASLSSRLYLIRHGLVEPHWRGRLYGDLDVPLDPLGRQQAEEVAERLSGVNLQALVSSDLERARFGAECLARGRALTPRSDRRLRELCRGDWAGRTAADVEAQTQGAWSRWKHNPARERPPGGESLEDLWQRVAPALDDLALEAAARARAAATHAAQPTGDPAAAAVAHGWVLRCAAASALGLPLDLAERLSVPPAAVLILDWPLAGHRHGRPILAGLDLDRPLQESAAWYRMPAPEEP